MIENLTSENLVDLQNQVIEWLFTHVLNYNTIYQGILIFASAFFAFIIFRMTKKRARALIDRLKWPPRYKRAAINLHKLLWPAITFLVIFIMTQIAASEIVGMNVWLIKGVMKALLAWIIIRAMVEFINNNAIRNILALGIWAIAALSIFGIDEYVATLMSDIGFTLGEKRITALVIAKSAFSLFILGYFALFVATLVEHRINRSKNMSKASKLLFAKIARIALVGVAIILGLIASGFDLSLFAVFSGAIGLGIGLGLQRSAANFFSGMTLLLDRSIEPGDVIELENGTFGWIEKMGSRHTEIITGSNKAYLIPNEELVTQRVINWSHGDPHIRVTLDFGVSYKSDPHKVIEIAKEAALKPERVVKSREPGCAIIRFGDSSIDFTLGFWIIDAHNGLTNIRGEVFLALWDAFKEHGIEIPYPHREVFMHQVSPATP